MELVSYIAGCLLGDFSLSCTSVCHFQLYYLRLPKDIKDYKVILMDATVATGAAAMMAIRVLLDHDVPEENILIVSLLMAEIGKQDTSSWTEGRAVSSHQSGFSLFLFLLEDKGKSSL
jgi:uracil phosphoribosyltransferase